MTRACTGMMRIRDIDFTEGWQRERRSSFERMFYCSMEIRELVSVMELSWCLLVMCVVIVALNISKGLESKGFLSLCDNDVFLSVIAMMKLYHYILSEMKSFSITFLFIK